MDRKLIASLLICIILLLSATCIVCVKKPQLHKMIIFEQIIYKRAK
ncbi:hypothetical protein II810_02810 [bacterium]|nr:hypothetical protein [bacterium]